MEELLRVGVITTTHGVRREDESGCVDYHRRRVRGS